MIDDVSLEPDARPWYPSGIRYPSADTLHSEDPINRRWKHDTLQASDAILVLRSIKRDSASSFGSRSVIRDLGSGQRGICYAYNMKWRTSRPSVCGYRQGHKPLIS